MRSHDYFEGLCGAIALGEATRYERALFLLHARRCSLCAQDTAVRDGELRALAREVRGSERWQPTVRQTVSVRIQEGQARGRRRTMQALGYACTASLLLNFVCSIGFPQRLIAALTPLPQPQLSSVPLRVIADVVVHAPRVPAR
ncbi:MAG TPA: hypothetical protein VME66_12575 [Candidatus Acidoferrales bacterium]|nr:hypothetical protein [Candidatus Acidoferrales bacterium]